MASPILMQLSVFDWASGVQEDSPMFYQVNIWAVLFDLKCHILGNSALKFNARDSSANANHALLKEFKHFIINAREI